MLSENTNSHETLLVRLLLVLAAVSVLVGLVGGLMMLIRLRAWLSAVIILAGSWSVAGVLSALAWLCQRGYQQAQADKKMISALESILEELRAASVHHVERGAETSAAEETTDTSQADRAEAMLEQLRELNVNLLLTDDQRQKKGRILAESSAKTLKQRAHDVLLAGDLSGAEDILAGLIRLEPDSPDVPALREKIEQARAKAESHEVAESARKVENLMAVSNFAGARDVAESLLGKYPNSATAFDMLTRVRREQEAFATEKRAQMYQKIEKEASARHWHSALEAARKFLDAWPDSVEAEAVRVQLSTISDNARIEEVRILRDRIRDMINRRRFGEALELARDVIERFPETAAATELTEQISRLEERAKSEPDDNK
ncbi:MAG: hypothetical protein SVV80_02100 [Planctomycetota bacterium]|nr:hypothetical protein [Planctomycetota bacterium]